MSEQNQIRPAMSVYEAIRRRRDVRAEFTGNLVDDETLIRILAAAHQAPSVGNTQPWDFVVVQNRCTLSAFAEHVAHERRRFAASLPAERRPLTDVIHREKYCPADNSV